MDYIGLTAHGSIDRRCRRHRKSAPTRTEETAMDSAPLATPLILLPPQREGDDSQPDEHTDRGRAVTEAFWHLRHFWP